ncbi:MAG TPA: methyltransferase domain-containing protein [Cyclobacteriaceae bacterium]|nr:methyltransferase domain-containing protein [Cyclobacteriaceae bacterium]
MDSSYYRQVSRYYDQDAGDFDLRYWSNSVLQRTRQSFREIVKSHSFDNMLEIGCGTGIDICHFARIYPGKKIYGIDISPEMCRIAENKVSALKLKNAVVKTGSPEDLNALFPGIKFDMIYVFFGALNTTENLRSISVHLHNKLNEDGKMILTFVNKWYLVEILINLFKLRFSKALRRNKSIWGGYSPKKFLPSRCLSPADIRKAFTGQFRITKQRGYSILFPAWYRNHWIKRFGRRISHGMWELDKMLNKTFLRGFGEYALYEFTRRV